MYNMQDGNGKNKMGKANLFDEVPKEITKIEETPNKVKIISGGKYALAVEDELPSMEQVKFVNRFGQFVEKPTGTGQEDISFYWRNNLRMLGVVMFVSSVGILIILLMASNQYLQDFWDLLIMIFDFVAGFIWGFIP